MIVVGRVVVLVSKTVEVLLARQLRVQDLCGGWICPHVVSVRVVVSRTLCGISVAVTVILNY